MIYTLTLNPSIDYTMSIDSIKLGDMNRSTKTIFSPGGKGVNVSLTLSYLGQENKLLGIVGGQNGAIFSNLLYSYKVNCDLLKIENYNTRVNVKLCHGITTEINAPATIVSENIISAIYQKLSVISEGDILIMGGSIPGGLPATIYYDIGHKLIKRGVIIILDADGEALREGIRAKPFLIKPNYREFLELISKNINEKSKIQKYAQQIQQKGVKNILLSMGGEGAFLFAADGNTYFSPAIKGTPLNTVGAGDTLLAGFIYYYFKSKDYQNSLEKAVELSGKAVCSMRSI